MKQMFKKDNIISKPELDEKLRAINEQLEYHDRLLQITKHHIWENNTAENLMLHELVLKTLKHKPNFTPLVSIIIPVYNGENFVREAIDSALAQTYKNIEVIVVNDGSTDKTEEILKSYGDKIIFYSKQNGGVSSALNYGIKKMHGEYFSWLSHDDLYMPNHIEHLIEWVSYEGHEKDIPFSMFRLIDDEGHVLYQDTINAQLFCSDFKVSYTKNELTLLKGEINGGSVLIPKKAFSKHGTFNESLRISQERDLWARLIKEYHFVNIPFDTSFIRVHQNQVSNTSPDVARESNDKNIEILNNIPKINMQKLFEDILFLYENLAESYSNNGKKVLEDYIKHKISELKHDI